MMWFLGEYPRIVKEVTHTEPHPDGPKIQGGSLFIPREEWEWGISEIVMEYRHEHRRGPYRVYFEKRNPICDMFGGKPPRHDEPYLKKYLDTFETILISLEKKGLTKCVGPGEEDKSELYRKATRWSLTDAGKEIVSTFDLEEQHLPGRDWTVKEGLFDMHTMWVWINPWFLGI